MPTPLDAVYFSALALASPYLALRAVRTGRYRNDLRARLFGQIELPAKTGPRVWFHAVSVGEVHVLRTLVPAFQQRFPHWQPVVSSGTDTGLLEARKLFDPAFAFPLDFSWAVGRALDAVQPDLLVLTEGELWPGLLRAAERRGIAVAVVNARSSPRSARRQQLFASLLRGTYRRVQRYACQTADHAAHLRKLGVDPTRIVVTGSIKYDGVTGDRQNERTAAFRALFRIQPQETVWVAGSTQHPEERAVLDAFTELRRDHSGLRLIVVPRHRERFDEVARLAVGGVRRSALTGPTDAPIIVLDTIGELSAVWGLADVAFVGGSLDGQRGGQNMIEPAAFGAAVLFGPHTWNFRHTVEQLKAADAAVEIANVDALLPAVRRLLDDPMRRAQLGERAMRFVAGQQGATQRTLDALSELMAGIQSPG